MSVNFTLKEFPVNGKVKRDCGLPFSCVVQPFAKSDFLPLDQPCSVKLQDVGRCQDCYSYVNRYCQFDLSGWSCSLCSSYNEYKSIRNRRYARSGARSACPELRRDLVEVECEPEADLVEAETPHAAEGNEAARAASPPVYIALVDTCSDEEFLEGVRNALLAALEAVEPAALFGLITFSNTVGLYDVLGEVPGVRHVPILDAASPLPTPLELEDALPLDALLAPVAAAKEAIAAVLDALQPAAGGGRGFGGAVQAVLRYLGGATNGTDVAQRESGGGASTSGRGDSGAVSTAYAGAHVLCFLSGPPTLGRGCVVQRRQPAPASPPPPQTPSRDSLRKRDIAAMVDPLYSYSFESPAKPQSSGSGIGSGGVLPPSPQTMAASGPAAADTDNPEEFELDPEAAEFYEEAAAAAASLGVCVDVYAAGRAPVGLAAIEPLASSSGGALYLYQAIEEATLPQDIFRRLSAPTARGAILRLRTSPEFAVSQAYGRMLPDPQFDNLHHILACDRHACYAFDFEHTSPAGFGPGQDTPPMLQMVFQYSVLVPDAGSSDGEGGAGKPRTGRFTLQRRMRILTTQAPIAASPRQVYEAARPDAILCLLLHKTLAACAVEGVEEARALLQDWLVLCCADYNRAMSRPGELDVEFAAVEEMQPVGRLVYALLRSPLLALPTGGGGAAGSDARACLQHLWRALPPDELRRAVYPVLASYMTPDQQAFPRHSLSRAALLTSGAPIFLLDTFTALIVYYAAGYPQDLPFPPPQASLLRRKLNELRNSRRITPQLKFLRGGFDDVTPFTQHLIEEPEAAAGGLGDAGPGRAAGSGFVMFLEQLRSEVQTCLEEGRE